MATTRDGVWRDGAWRTGFSKQTPPATSNDGAWRDGYHQLHAEGGFFTIGVSVIGGPDVIKA